MADQGGAPADTAEALPRTVGAAMARTSMAANLTGALVVFLSLQFLSRGVVDPHLPHSSFAVTIAVFAVYLACAMPAGLLWMKPAFRAARCIGEQRPPLVAWAAGSAVPLVALGLTPFVRSSAGTWAGRWRAG